MNHFLSCTKGDGRREAQPLIRYGYLPFAYLSYSRLVRDGIHEAEAAAPQPQYSCCGCAISLFDYVLHVL
jgi:hypothetical protein